MRCFSNGKKGFLNKNKSMNIQLMEEKKEMNYSQI